ncbi:MAG: hypothetical protein H6684_12615 [Deltaproteobacteria bacterium]|nr:hypothetical protein [bacterium]MCB9476887.1 hypothetical protein [Deltaproteobacteria bacterium]MCB9480042.1 hypothetical protein [Deltaproteobacteria bacterium]MCB9489567.1 hypothetical protein [Deltaproteobacteria bacterium]
MPSNTTTEFIDNVHAEIRDIRNKIDELERQKTDIDRQISSLGRDIKRRNDLLLVWEGKADVRPMVERKPRERSRRGFTMNTVILEILEAAGRPLSAHDILDELTRRNAQGNSKNPISSVRNALQILKKRGQIISPSYGMVCIPGQETPSATPRTIRRPAAQNAEA